MCVRIQLSVDCPDIPTLIQMCGITHAPSASRCTRLAKQRSIDVTTLVMAMGIGPETVRSCLQEAQFRPGHIHMIVKFVEGNTEHVPVTPGSSQDICT